MPISRDILLPGWLEGHPHRTPHRGGRLGRRRLWPGHSTQLGVATAADGPLQELTLIIEDGPPARRNQMPPSIRDYFPFVETLSNIDGVICRGNRIIIPTSLRPTRLNALHAAHQGVSRMTARAEASLFWPGITKDITAARNGCATCNSNTPNDAISHPFQHIAADFFHHQGNTYLVLVDSYTNWPVVTPSREGASGLVQTLRETFSTFGIPDTLTSDGSPEFSSHTTRRFLVDWGVHHRTASAYRPHANCRAEVAVKTIKRLLAGNTGPGGALTDQFHKALLQYRNSPDPETNMSPAACLFRRPTRDLHQGISDPAHPEG